MIKNSVVETQKPVVNHESRPVKSNPATHGEKDLEQIFFNEGFWQFNFFQFFTARPFIYFT